MTENKLKMTLSEAISDTRLFAPWFENPDSWRPWMTFHKAVYGEQMTRAERKFFKTCTNRSRPPAGPVTAVHLIIGRRGGKSFITALNGVYLATFRDYRPYLARGERAHIVIIAVDRRQAQVLMSYVKSLITDVPLLRQMVVREASESIELNNGVTIEIFTASFRSTRGYTIAAALCDELSFWRTDDSANPDKEIINALRPGMSTIPGSMLWHVGSPYGRRGVQWEAYRDGFGKNDPHTLIWQAPTWVMNPTISKAIIEEAYERDPISAASEYGAEFRRDIEGYVSIEVLQSCIYTGRYELPPTTGIRYMGFVDPSGGSQDSMTLALSHRQGEKVILDCIRERKPPFSPDEVVKEFCGILKNYGVSRVFGDRYAGEWPRERFQKQGILYVPSEKTRSELYLELLPVLNAGAVELLDNKTLLHQLQGLERRTSSVRDSIDHGPGSHDDVANAAAGAVFLCSKVVTPMTSQKLREGTILGDPSAVGRQIAENGSWEKTSCDGGGIFELPNASKGRRWDW